MATKTLATLEAELDVAIAALDALKDSVDAELESEMYLADTKEFQRSMSADCEKMSLQLTGFKAQAAVRAWPTT